MAVGFEPLSLILCDLLACLRIRHGSRALHAYVGCARFIILIFLWHLLFLTLGLHALQLLVAIEVHVHNSFLCAVFLLIAQSDPNSLRVHEVIVLVTCGAAVQA